MHLFLTAEEITRLRGLLEIGGRRPWRARRWVVDSEVWGLVERSDGPENSLACEVGSYDNAELIAAAVNALPLLIDELIMLREYEAQTRNTICWNVECEHQARALDAIMGAQKELDDTKAKLKAAEGVIERLKADRPPGPTKH